MLHRFADNSMPTSNLLTLHLRAIFSVQLLQGRAHQLALVLGGAIWFEPVHGLQEGANRVADSTKKIDGDPKRYQWWLPDRAMPTHRPRLLRRWKRAPLLRSLIFLCVEKATHHWYSLALGKTNVRCQGFQMWGHLCLNGQQHRFFLSKVLRQFHGRIVQQRWPDRLQPSGLLMM